MQTFIDMKSLYYLPFVILFFLFIGDFEISAQEKESGNKLLYLGVEPLMWLMGEKGGYLAYSANEKLTFQFYGAHYGC
jgi:hypothetical protein